MLLVEGFSEIIKSEFVKSYKENLRKPEIRFYCPVEIEDQITRNSIPAPKVRCTAKKKPSISVSPFENHVDYQLTLNDRIIGAVYFSIIDDLSYTAVIGDTIAGHHNSLEELIRMLNAMYSEKKLEIK
jgi:hypothetical protein